MPRDEEIEIAVGTASKAALVLQPEAATPADAVTSAKAPRPSFCSSTLCEVREIQVHVAVVVVVAGGDTHAVAGHVHAAASGGVREVAAAVVAERAARPPFLAAERATLHEQHVEVAVAVHVEAPRRRP